MVPTGSSRAYRRSAGSRPGKGPISVWVLPAPGSGRAVCAPRIDVEHEPALADHRIVVFVPARMLSSRGSVVQAKAFEHVVSLVKRCDALDRRPRPDPGREGDAG